MMEKVVDLHFEKVIVKGGQVFFSKNSKRLLAKAFGKKLEERINESIQQQQKIRTHT